MSNEVVLVGRAELDQILKSLKKFRDQGEQSQKTIQQLGKKTNETLENSTKKAETKIKQTGALLRRMASSLYSDFKALMSLNSLQGAMKLSSMFSGAVGDAIDLSDTIRRLGTSFGIAQKDFGSFHALMTKGLGEIGASSEEAAKALEGLSGLGLKDQNAILSMTKGAVELASMSGERGNTKQVAGQLGSVLRAQGKDVNDVGSQKALMGEVTAAVKTTGKGASEILGAMDEIFSKMPQDLRKKVGPKFMAQMAAVATTAGPGATQAISKLFSMDKIQRMGLEAQGFHPFDKKGNLDMNSLMKFVKEVGSRGGMGARAGLKTAGLSDEEAEGLVRLAEQTDRVTQTLGTLEGATRDTEQAYKDSRGFVESFKGAISNVTGTLQSIPGVGTAMQKVTDMMSGAASSKAGSFGVVAGGATIAALMAGGGLKGITGLIGGEMKKKAFEEATGEKVQDVFVVNADQIGGNNSPLAAAGGMGMLGKAGMVGAALTGGLAIGEGVNWADKQMGGGMGDAIVAGFDKLDKWMGGMMSGTDRSGKTNKVYIETKTPNLRQSDKPSRGGSG